MNNTFYKGYYEDHYLAHHGILGMKWGKKNGPPYPLGASDHSASEKAAGYKKSLGGGRNENLYDRKKEKKNTSETKRDSKTKVNKSTLTDKQKKALKVGAAVVGGAAVAIGAAYVAKRLNTKVTNAVIKEYREKGEAWSEEYLAFKMQGSTLWDIAERARNVNVKDYSLAAYAAGLSNARANMALDEMRKLDRRAQSKKLFKADKKDYIKRKLLNKPRSLTTAELHKLGIDTIGTSPKNNDELIELLSKIYLKKG